MTSTLALLAYLLVMRQSLVGYPAATYWNLIALALVTQVTGYLAINYALGHLPASIVSPTMLGQPVLTALLAVIFLSEPLGWAQILGGGAGAGGDWDSASEQNVRATLRRPGL